MLKDAGFTILIDVYERLGRFDCFWCPNQSPKQVKKLIEHYPEKAQEWAEAEARKGHSFKSVPIAAYLDPELALRIRTHEDQGVLGCACFGGADDFFGENP